MVQLYLKLFQILMIPWHVEGLDHDFEIPTCTFVGPPPQDFFPKELFRNLVDTLE